MAGTKSRGMRSRPARLRIAVLMGLSLVVPFAVTLACTAAVPLDASAPKTKTHRLAIQINSDDPTAMRHAIVNAINATRYYTEQHETLAVEIVAYGPGIHMFRDDTSPVKELLTSLRAVNPTVVFSVCGNSKTIMELKEGRPLSFVDGARVVPYGVGRLIDLEEAGWSYLRP